MLRSVGPLERWLVETNSHQALLQLVLPATVHRQNPIPATTGAVSDPSGKKKLDDALVQEQALAEAILFQHVHQQYATTQNLGSDEICSLWT
ncbi:hypothetical protein TB2_034769 [Malus domestica]